MLGSYLTMVPLHAIYFITLVTLMVSYQTVLCGVNIQRLREFLCTARPDVVIVSAGQT